MQASDVAALDEKGRLEYFFEHAGYSEDAPQKPYSIRIGTSSTALFAADTMELREMFERELNKIRRESRRYSMGKRCKLCRTRVPNVTRVLTCQRCREKQG